MLFFVLKSTTAKGSTVLLGPPRRRLLAAVAVNKISPPGVGRMKSVRATKTPSYITENRTNNWRWEQQAGREWDVPRREAASGRRRDARTGEHEAAAATTVCAPIG